MSMNAGFASEQRAPGALLPGRIQAQLGLVRYNYFACADCKTEFPQIGGEIRCNGHNIAQCPWCRPDSKPWTDGRGL